ncbi:MAG: hypothetical protein J2P15_05415 [Micromonosporaceae bacterium]|nr:hypothetical protein [Micromonosporaceae bacterium]
MTANDEAWVPDACTLSTVERTQRVAEFDELFAGALREQRRLSPTGLRWLLDPAAEQAARELAARESACCSFFSFTFTRAEDGLRLEIAVPDAHRDVLDALERLVSR